MALASQPVQHFACRPIACCSVCRKTCRVMPWWATLCDFRKHIAQPAFACADRMRIVYEKAGSAGRTPGRSGAAEQGPGGHSQPSSGQAAGIMSPERGPAPVVSVRQLSKELVSAVEGRSENVVLVHGRQTATVHDDPSIDDDRVDRDHGRRQGQDEPEIIL